MATWEVDEDDFASITGEWKRDTTTPYDADTPVEQHFLLQLRDTPDDLAMRMVFADWLEERGYYHKAVVVRLLADPPIEGSEAMRQLRAATLWTPGDWLAIVCRTPIERCRGPLDARMNLVCPRTWDRLVSTDAPKRRWCSECGDDVHFCATLDEVRERGETRDVIALSPPLHRSQALEAYDTHGTVWADGTDGIEITVETEPIDDDDL
jgi:uncharacterized protein (TIGR02996 family)